MKRLLLTALGCLLAALSLQANAPQGRVLRMGNANVTAFDDGWRFRRYGLQPEGTRVDEPEGLEQAKTDDSAWRSLDLPHDYAIEGPFRIDLAGNTGKLPYQGIGWYRKRFTLKRQPGERVYVDFDGAMANAKLWLNGRYVGTWPYGYSSFRMDLTPHLKDGENVLAVRLDTENLESRWYSGAGLYRHVWLVRCQPVHVAHWGTFVTTPDVTDEAATVRMEIDLDNFLHTAVDAKIVTTYHELNADDTPGREVARSEQTVRLHANADNHASEEVRIASPKRWDITSPNRYLARTQVYVDGKLSDTYNTPFGIRTIRFSVADGFQLNGRRVPIKGVCLHHDLGSLGAAFNRSALERQLKIMMEMGCNSIRTSHNPPAPELLELCDKMGLLVWDEAFDTWARGKRAKDYSRLFEQWHEKDLTALVRRDRNHPSVFIWSIGNEVMDQRNVELTRHLCDIVRRLDPTRPISNGYNDPNGGRACGAATALDVMGVNYFFGQQAKWEADPRYADMPTIASETSSCLSTRGLYFFDGARKDWQISSYDCDSTGWGCTPDVQFRTNRKFPKMLGEYVWTGFDYLGEPTPYNSDATNLLNYRTDPTKKAELEAKLAELARSRPPSRSSYFGIVDLAGFPKDRYYLYQSEWLPEKPMAHLLPHWNWPERVGQKVPVHVYTSGDEAELFLNGKSQGRLKKRPGEDFRLVWKEVVYEPGTLRVVTYRDGREWATAEVQTTGPAAALTLEPDRREVLSDGSELAFVTLCVKDAEGRVAPRADNEITFSVEGPGEIVSTDNGNPIDHTSFSSHTRRALSGKALVIVRAKRGQTGKIVVKAASPNLAPAQTEVLSR